MQIALIFPILFGCIGVACLLWVPRGRKVGGVEPRCAACGYIVHGLPSSICPECGSDLSRPNAIITSGHLPPGRFVRSVAWTIFCLLTILIPLSACWSIVMQAMPQIHSNSSTATLSQPASYAYQSITLLAQSQYRAYSSTPEPPPKELQLELTQNDGAIRILMIDSVTLVYWDPSTPGSSMKPHPIDAASLAAWLKSNGVQGDAGKINAEMSLVMSQVHQLVSSPPTHSFVGHGEFSNMSSGSSSSVGPIPWIGGVPLLVGAIIWLIGLLRILMKPSTAGTVSKSSPHII